MALPVDATDLHDLARLRGACAASPFALRLAVLFGSRAWPCEAG
jgi:hypothetical protein